VFPKRLFIYKFLTMWSTIDIADRRSLTAIAILKKAMDKYHEKNQDREEVMEVTGTSTPGVGDGLDARDDDRPCTRADLKTCGGT
jgi:hypothetical protein